VRGPLRIALAVAAVLAVLALVGGLALVGLARSGLSTHGEPSAAEVFAARAMRRWATPADLRGNDNALALSPAVLADGRAHWADHCATCHGNDGKGQTTMGRRLYPRAPDMTLPATQDLSDGELFAIIENGVRLTGMPGWGDGTAQSAYGSWALVHFIRHLPQLTAEEIGAMEALNPKSAAEWEALQAEREFLEGGDAPPPSDHDAAGHTHGH
jgi:mono/diheme cytochrome c family protein